MAFISIDCLTLLRRQLLRRAWACFRSKVEMPTAPLTWHRMNSGRLKVALLARMHYTFRAFQKGLSPLWSAVQFIALVVGGSAVAYLAVALDKPLFAIVLFLLGALITAGEGAFRLNKASEAELAKADETIL